MSTRSLIVLVSWLSVSSSAWAVDYVTLRRVDQQIQIEGRRLLTAEDGGILLLARDGVLWAVQPNELINQSSDASEFKPLSADALAKRLLEELPPDFKIHRTAHYLIPYNTSRAYAEWNGALFERLYMAFTNFWSRRGFELKEPDFPLVAIVFAEKKDYVDFSRADVGKAAEVILGYFNIQSNQMVMYDLTGFESFYRRNTHRVSSLKIRQILARPEASRTVATIVHEATHQIAFNCGLHTRLSDCPLWFSEGIALYFETPDLSSSKGWRTIGAVNRVRLERFRHYLSRRPANSLKTLLSDDQRLRDTALAEDAYSEAWALTYFLLRKYPKPYLSYMQTLSAKKPMIWDEPETRLKEFQQAFGEDLDRLDREMIRMMGRAN